MCGIIACINCTNTETLLMNGLKQLQNRGYDSCGIAKIVDGNIIVQKYASTLEEKSINKLESKLTNNLNVNIGIAHTRWATHGPKTDLNAHPHNDCNNKLSLVHNGIITNYQCIKDKLENKGYKFNSETDTEVISNLISSELDIKNPFNSIKKSLDQLDGTWGLVIMLKEKPNSLFISRSGSPLLLGKTTNGIIVASEISAFCNLTNKIYEIEDGEILEINIEDNKVNSNELNNYCLNNFLNLTKKIKVERNCIKQSPYPFNHWMMKEIFEQPMAVLRTLNYGARIHNSKVKLGGLDISKNLILNKNRIIIIGCGTSLNAGKWVSYYYKKLKVFDSVLVIDASEFELYEITEIEKTVCLVLSQSGETKDVHRCMNKIKTLNIPIIGIVNVVGSLIARESTCGIYLNAGREVAVASTKSFMCQMIGLLLVGLWYTQNTNKDNVLSNELVKEVLYVSSMIDNVLNSLDTYKNIAKYLCNHHSCFILGRNMCKAIADEAALKLKEIGYIHAEGFAGGSLKHGPFSLIENGTPVFLLILDDEYREYMVSTLEEVKTRGAYTIVITNCDLNDNAKIDEIITIDKMKVLSSIPIIVPFQLIAYEMALIKNNDPDYPRNLAKVVTVD